MLDLLATQQFLNQGLFGERGTGQILDLSPGGFMDGKDEQLDYAIQDLMKKIAQDPKNLPKAPPIEPRPLHAAR